VLPETLLHAVRILGVDVANGVSQVAIYKAHAEEINSVLSMIDERSWERRMIPTGDEDDSKTFETVLPPDQDARVLRLIELCRSMG
jgi:hypothetical protein